MKKDDTKAYDVLMQSIKELGEHHRGEKEYPKHKAEIMPVPAMSANDLKAVREELGYSQQRLALYLGVSKRTVEAWEQRGNPVPGPVSRLLALVRSDHSLLQKA